jgi:uncharacterized protein
MFVQPMLTKELYEIIRSKILSELRNNLSKDLWYHGVHHTIDVEKEAERIAISEKITNQEDLLLLKIACLYHDSGFLFTYKEHEVAGCNLAKKDLAGFGLSKKQIDVICGMIMATRIPQTPHTKLEEIICDADLDYFGRDDFFPIANTLFLELKARSFVTSEYDWNVIQRNFFKQHRYFTDTTKKLRGKQKQRYFEMIEAMV